MGRREGNNGSLQHQKIIRNEEAVSLWTILLSLESKGNENNALSLWIFIMTGLCWPGRISRAAIHPDTYMVYSTYTTKTLPEKNTTQEETGSRSTLPGWMSDSLLLFLEIQANHLQCALQMNSVRATGHLFNEGIAQTRIVKTQQIWPRSSVILLSSGYCSAPTLRENRGMGPWGIAQTLCPTEGDSSTTRDLLVEHTRYAKGQGGDRPRALLKMS